MKFRKKSYLINEITIRPIYIINVLGIFLIKYFTILVTWIFFYQQLFQYLKASSTFKKGLFTVLVVHFSNYKKNPIASFWFLCQNQTSLKHDKKRLPNTVFFTCKWLYLELWKKRLPNTVFSKSNIMTNVSSKTFRDCWIKLEN